MTLEIALHEKPYCPRNLIRSIQQSNIEYHTHNHLANSNNTNTVGENSDD